MIEKTVMWKEGFKVCNRIDGRYLSLFNENYPSHTVRYYTDRRIYIYRQDGFGPLTVLKSFKAALFLVQNIISPRKPIIFRRLYLPSKDHFVWIPNATPTPIAQLERQNSNFLIAEETDLADIVRLLPEQKGE